MLVSFLKKCCSQATMGSNGLTSESKKKLADPIRAVSGVKPLSAYMISFCIYFRL